MKLREKVSKDNCLNIEVSAGVQDLIAVYDKFKDAYASTEKYLQIMAPKNCQMNSNQSFVS